MLLQVPWPFPGSCSCTEGGEGLKLSCSQINSTKGLSKLDAETLAKVREIVIRDSWGLLCLDLRHLVKLPALKRLEVSRADLSQLFCDTVKSDRYSLSELHTFEVTFTKLRSIEGAELPEMQNLKHINLSNNKLENLSQNAFIDLDHLESLDLSNNLLDHNLKREAFQGISVNLKELDISGITYMCQFQNSQTLLHR